MTRNLLSIMAFGAALIMFTGAPEATAQPKGKPDHPRLRAALHEMREARSDLKNAADAWPPGYKERALGSINDAIKSVQLILAVKDVNAFVGVDRNPDYYKRYKDHGRLRAALADLRDARDELKTAKADFGDLRERALDDIDVAIGDILTLVRHDKRD